RFKLEAQSAASLKHQNICPVYDFGEIDGTPFITMAFIDGYPLSRLVVKDNQDQRWIADIIRTLADALSHAHELGVVHRDLKPGNILIEKNGTPHITDFGLACRVDREDQSRLTQEGAIMGTPLYMAPEQVEGKVAQIGPCTDIYALGVILYELLTGETPFRGSAASIFAQIIRDNAKPPIEMNRFADKTLARLSLKMMSKRPESRPQSMADVIAELDEVLSTPVAASHSTIDSKTERSIKKLDAAKSKINDLVKRGQYAQAVKLLEKLATLTAPEAVGYANWARAELPRVQAIPKKKRSNLPAVIATAKKLIDKYDYGQAAEMLQQIPSNIRNAEANQLLDKAIDLQDEVDLLLADLQGCVRRKEYEGIEDNLKRLLEIKPGNRFAKELWEALQTYSNVPAKSRKYNVDKQGKLQPNDDDLGSILLKGIAVAVVAFVIAFAGITFYLKSGQLTVAVTFDEELLKNGDLTLTFDGKNYTIDGPEFNLKVAAGEYGYEVRQGKTIVRNPETFTVVSDGRNVLQIGKTSSQIAEREVNAELLKTSDAQSDLALAFPKLADSATYVEVSSLPALGDTPITIEAWVRPGHDAGITDETKESFVSIIEYPLSDEKIGFSLGTNNVDSKWNRTHPSMISVRQAKYKKNFLSAPTPLQREKWSHLAATVDDDILELFENGKLVRSMVLKGQCEVRKYKMYFGVYATEESGVVVNPSMNFYGRLDEVRISNVVRYKSDFTPSRRFEPDDVTLALYHCDEGSGTVLKDSSGNDHHGTIIDATFRAVHDGDPILAMDFSSSKVVSGSSSGEMTKSDTGPDTAPTIKITPKDDILLSGNRFSELDTSKKYKLEWEPVPGAASYKIERHFLNVAQLKGTTRQRGRWMEKNSADVGNQTSWNVGFFGANLHRVRVIAISKDGQSKVSSSWLYYCNQFTRKHHQQRFAIIYSHKIIDIKEGVDVDLN
ncbi:MAG TPA: hypothetical protein DD473_14485, partial [Planctomycetaceae bacterium]|nr:hypothetical protein [Planctomycetaceae bacterium]